MYLSSSTLGEITMKRLRYSSLPRLPSDLVEEILVRVPATSLKRLRSTCKQWNTLFNDHKFTKKHFEKSRKQYLALMLWDLGISTLRFNLREPQDNIGRSPIELNGELSLTDPNCNSNKFEVHHVFHCNGLLLCTNKSNRIVVWNPCTGQTKWIQTKTGNRIYHKYALGYENNNEACHNYKILSLLDCETFELEIYEFNSDSWRVLDSFDLDFEIHGDGVSLKGNTYWVACDNEPDEEIHNCFLMSFDFATERFGPHVCLPFKGFCYSDIMSLSSVREERLSVLFQDENTSTLEIWMTNNIVNETKAMSWSIFLRFDLDTFRFMDDVSFFIEDNKVVVCSDDLKDDYDEINNIVYIFGEDGWKEVSNFGEGLHCPRMFNYVPSFVQLI